MKRLKITSDGTINGTIVTDADTGENIAGIKRMNIEFDVEKLYPIVTVELISGFILDAIAVVEENQEDKKN